jgi:hypothetical protein
VGCCPQLSHQWPTDARAPESLRQYVERWYRWLLGELGRMVSQRGGLPRLEKNMLRCLGIDPER